MNKLVVKNEKGVDINRDMFGLFFEDLNYAADGGLYAEMIENRNFEFVETKGFKDHYSRKFDGLYGWEPYSQKGNVVLECKTEEPQNEVNPHYLEVRARRGGVGFTNRSYGGSCIEKDKRYHLKFWCRNCSGYNVEISSFLEDDFGIGTTSESVIAAGDQWIQLEIWLTALRKMKNGHLVICLGQCGTVDFDMVSLMPEGAVLGIFRSDLTELLKEINPGFLRFPGGCIVEGNNLDNRYQWKNTIGPVELRKVDWNRWAVHDTKQENDYKTEFSHYNQTFGLGFYEYFLLCEYLKAKPVPVMNAGLACQYQSTELVSCADAEFDSYIQDVLDLIEFANGASDSRWGAIRTEMGHPEPFGLEYIGIGNEQWETADVDYFQRYSLFEEKIHRYYPHMKLLSSAGPTVKTAEYENAWRWIRGECQKRSGYTYAIDEHYYMPPQWFYDNTDFYDKYPRNVKVFAGEYAAHPEQITEFQQKNNLSAALAEAAFMTGMERNADVVVMACYAPLFARIGYAQWSPDLIWFDGGESYRTPSYFVQKFFSSYTGNQTLKYEIEGKEQLYYAPSFNTETGAVYIKIVNPNSIEVKLNICFEGEWKLDSHADLTTISSGELQSVNGIGKEEITERWEKETVIGNQLEICAAPYSCGVLILEKPVI